MVAESNGGLLGANLLGWAFADGPVLATCATNAVNALVKRHLVEPANKIDTFQCHLLELGIDQLKLRFEEHMVSDPDAWRIGKGLAKLRKVDDSLAEDPDRFDTVQLMVKREVYSQPFDAPPGVKKARGIQFAKNERSAYEYAREYHSFSKALVDVSKEPFECGGVEFLVVYSAKMAHKYIGEFATES
jgi:cystathionine beta-lyase/cystathionine gamma-synthase